MQPRERNMQPTHPDRRTTPLRGSATRPPSLSHNAPSSVCRDQNRETLSTINFNGHTPQHVPLPSLVPSLPRAVFSLFVYDSPSEEDGGTDQRGHGPAWVRASPYEPAFSLCAFGQMGTGGFLFITFPSRAERRVRVGFDVPRMGRWSCFD